MLCDIPAAVRQRGREAWYGMLSHVPKLGQRLFDEAVDGGKRFVALFTPPQDGKSYHIAKHIGPYLFLDDVHIWIVGPTYMDACKEFGYVYQDLAVLGKLRACSRKHYDIRGGNMHIELRNGSWIQVISAENPENLRREQLDVVVLAEASKLNENLYDRYLYARVEKRNGLVLVPTTHKGYGWVHDRFYVPSQPMKPKSWQWGPWVDGRRQAIGGEPNPRYDPEHWSCQVSYVADFGDVFHGEKDSGFRKEQIEKARSRLPLPMFAEQFGGEAASYAGLVYQFDPAIHECDVFDVPRSWTHIVGYDHGAGGGSDPTAIEIGSYAPDGTLYWWQELYDTEVRPVKARASLLRVMLHGREPMAIVRGHEAKQIGKELLDEGFVTTFPKDGGPEARILRMSELLGTKKFKILRGRCPHLKRELLSYEWDEKHPGKPKDGNDHCVEAAGNATLVSVGLPDTSVATMVIRPEELKAKILHDQVWGPWERERAREEAVLSGKGLERILEPDPLTVEEWVAR